MKKFVIVFALVIILLISSCEIIVPQYTPTLLPTFTPDPATAVPESTSEVTATPISETTDTPAIAQVTPTTEIEDGLSDVPRIDPVFVEISHYMLDDYYKAGDGFQDAVDLEYATSSTFLTSQEGNTYEAGNLYDFDLDTAWCEGASDYGIGEWALYYIKAQDYAPDAVITKLEIINGYIKSDDVFEDNSMPKEILVLVDEENWCVLNLSKDKRIQQFDISDIDLSVSEQVGIKFVILDVYEGDVYEDTCITAIEFCGTGIY